MANLDTLGLLFLCLIVIISGCTTNQGAGMSPDEQRDHIVKRPSSEEIVATYEKLRGEITDKLSRELSLPAWTPAPDTKSQSGCGNEFPDLGTSARNITLDIYYTTAHISDEMWPKALQDVSTLVSQQGFGAPNLVSDKPGNHVAEFHDPYGGLLSFGTQVNTSVSFRTGCHAA
jgi:hypothetical protein